MWTSKSWILEHPKPHQHIGLAVLHLAGTVRVTRATLQLKVLPGECLPALTKLGKGLTSWPVLLAAERVADPMKDWPDCICEDALYRRLHSNSELCVWIYLQLRQVNRRCPTERFDQVFTAEKELQRQLRCCSQAAMAALPMTVPSAVCQAQRTGIVAGRIVMPNAQLKCRNC